MHYNRNSLFIIVLMLSCIFIIGCQSIDKKTPDHMLTEDMYREPTEISSFKELSSTTGDHSFDVPFSDVFPFEINDPLFTGDDQSPTGKWILTDGEGRFGYTIPSGMVQAGSSIQVGLIHASNGTNELDRDVRVQINPCTNINICDEPIVDSEEFVAKIEDEYIAYENEIPTKVDRLYRVSLEILNEDIIEDTLISYIYVPSEQLNASIEQTEDTEDKQSFLLTNDGPTAVVIGEDFTIEQFIENQWSTIPYQVEVKDIGIILYPGNDIIHTVDTSTFPSGTYRIVKKVQSDPYALEAVISTTFSVK